MNRTIHFLFALITVLIYNLNTQAQNVVVGGGQLGASGQEYKVSFSKPSQPGKVKIYTLNEVNIQSHNGKEVVITATGVRPIPKRAEGLKPVYNSMVDNTNMGLAVKEIDNTIEINSLTRNGDTKYKILVPANASIQISSGDNHGGSHIHISNFSNEIEIDARFGDVELEDITGPALVHSVHGKINVKFAKVNPKNPISITSVHGDVDVSMPAKTPANLELKSGYGEIYTDLDIAFENTKDNMRQISGNRIAGKLNGGGVEIHLESTHSNIYLRKVN
jgi:lia operon protein LiaG